MAVISEAAAPTERVQLRRSKSRIDSAILSPGAVNIDFHGAFILDEELPPTSEDGAQHDSKRIRLPNHKTIVSHVALDASVPIPDPSLND